MKNLRLLLPSLALAALTASGCWLVSGQFLVSFDLPPSLVVNSATTIAGASINLNTISDYKDHKSDLKDLADCALLGKFTNTGSGSLDVVVYLTPAATPLLTTKSALDADGTKIHLWGPLKLAAGASRSVGWDESAKLFTKAGKAALVQQVKGDGQFAIYAVGATAPYSLTLEKGVAVVVIDAGK
ncbi:MAG TPA: hypothetical protein VGK89_01395 [Candidatus Eisenbacteria bacterium]|jgi:hypothetical protein